MTEQEYRQAEGVNKSTLWELRKSPAHYQYILTHQREDTPALRIGSPFRCADSNCIQTGMDRYSGRY